MFLDIQCRNKDKVFINSAKDRKRESDRKGGRHRRQKKEKGIKERTSEERKIEIYL